MDVAGEHSAPAVNTTDQPVSSRRHPNRRRNNQLTVSSDTHNGPEGPRDPRPRDTRRKPNRRPGLNGEIPGGQGPTADTSLPVSNPSGNPRHRTPRRRNPTDATNSNDGSTPAARSSSDKPPRNGRRGAKFNAGLTDTSAPGRSDGHARSQTTSEKYKTSAPKADDLTSRLIHDLSTPPYPDCAICFAPIHPAQPTWSCSPSIPISSNSNDEPIDDNNRRQPGNTQCCWTTFHMKCIRSWASKSVKELEDAWRARGENRKGEWRCPGCQAKRDIVPSGYWCFCGSTPEPKLSRLATPHSCADLCSRPRACGHACPLICHPGPCPPCQVTTQLPCHCCRETLSFRCSHLSPGRDGPGGTDLLSCGKVCNKKLQCGNHSCESVCHPGNCAPCTVRTQARCYCGKVSKELACGEGEEKNCAVDAESWVGRFVCTNTCDRPFDCGIHFCEKSCHPPSRTPPQCPRSPSLVTHCPCGKHALSPSESSAFPPRTLLSRTKCADPIPTCTSICMKPLSGCSHVCSSKCHTGSCPPCAIMIVRPCRCGATTKDIRCSDLQAGLHDEILCDRACGALRACGRHQCNRICCPLASFGGGITKGKGKKRAVLDEPMDVGGLHECDLVCGKMLACGNHRCEERDHKGVCPPCLRSTFEEMICYCGRTVLEPPIPCGTRISCSYPCTRPAPPCGHPRTQHSCHEDPAPCPPCPFLTNKTCACGKKVVGNVRCSQEKVSCGTTCGKLLACGFHPCERLCHSDECGPCSSPCGKPRKLCLPEHHPCTSPCHAPSACPEMEPCQSIVVLTCPCKRIRQSVLCGRSTSNLSGRDTSSQQPKCSTECAVAKRNARLAEALGITSQTREQFVSYNDDVTGFAKVPANSKFVALVEKTFADFVESPKKTQVLPHMPPDRRQFVRDLASVYRMDTQMVDQEPHRSVQLLRRVDTRIPTPLLSAFVASTAPSLGKLADLRSSNTPWRRDPLPSAPVPLKPGSTQRGWTSVATRSATATPAPPKVPSPALSHVIRGQSAMSALHPPGSSTTTVSRESNGIVAEHDVPDNWEDDA